MLEESDLVDEEE